MNVYTTLVATVAVLPPCDLDAEICSFRVNVKIMLRDRDSEYNRNSRSQKAGGV